MALALLRALPPSTREQLSHGVTWLAVGLYESATSTVRLEPAASHDTGGGSAIAVATVGIEYRLLIATGTGSPSPWDVLDAAALSTPSIEWPVRRRTADDDEAQRREEHAPWFVTPLLVPDAWLASHADAGTLAEWARLTGRSGAPDRYWFLDSWDRFLEPGRRVGWLTANDVWRPRRGRLASAASTDDETQADDPAVPRRPPLTLTPDLERGVGVPPGYALVRCVGELSVVVVAQP